MPQTAYPTDADILAILTQSGAVLPAGFSTSGLAAAASAEWESATGWRPFLSSGVATVRVYDPPGPNGAGRLRPRACGGGDLLDLEAGAISVTSVTVGVTDSSPGTVLIEGQDYWAEPLNSSSEGLPFERIRFRLPQFGLPASIAVSAVFGYGLDLPDDVWQAVAAMGASIAFEQLGDGRGQRPTEWQEDTVRESWSAANAAARSRLRAAADRILRRYVRLGGG